MVRAGITLDCRTTLHVFERGCVTGVRYRYDVLEPYVPPFRTACGPELILMDDNARKHKFFSGRIISREDIHLKDWSASSPDLNPKSMSGTITISLVTLSYCRVVNPCATIEDPLIVSVTSCLNITLDTYVSIQGNAWKTYSEEFSLASGNSIPFVLTTLGFIAHHNSAGVQQ
ncbi:transposable element Tcb2 transposase [Trichonephila clavipes]|nr:transposable element Tcb2 transposase [Trichonephila clavipes]